jgi:hypothetical protein
MEPNPRLHLSTTWYSTGPGVGTASRTARPGGEHGRRLQCDTGVLSKRCHRIRRLGMTAWPQVTAIATELGVPISVPTVERPCKSQSRHLERLSPLCEAKSGSDNSFLARQSIRRRRCAGSRRVSQKAPQTNENAPREVRTPTVQTDHKALNLARFLAVLSYRPAAHVSSGDDGRSGTGGRSVCCHGVVTGSDMVSHTRSRSSIPSISMACAYPVSCV